MAAQRTHPRRGIRRGPLALALACLSFALAPGVAAAAPVSAPAAGAEPGYWTPERMRAAENFDLSPASAFPARGAPLTRAAAAEPGPALTVPPAGDGDVVASGGAPGGPNFQSGTVANPSAAGTRTHGRVFFRVPGEGDGSCSGTAIRSNRKSLVLTAGHCVHGGGHRGRWFRNPIFVPAYDQGARPFGTWRATRLYTTPIWVEFKDPTGDFAVVTTAKNAAGRLQKVVGARGIAFGRSPDKRYTAYGYPANPGDGFNGETERFCRSRFQGRDPSSAAGRGPRTIAIACDMTQGASGGGWVTGKGIVGSLTSYGYPELDDIVFGPYLGGLAREVYEASQIRCKGKVATIVGTPKGDRIKGTRRADVIVAGGGNDTVLASPKRDVVCGGPGRDRLAGGAGGDVLLGGRGNDTLIGGSGVDRCNGGSGRDKARGCEHTRNVP